MGSRRGSSDTERTTGAMGAMRARCVAVEGVGLRYGEPQEQVKLKIVFVDVSIVHTTFVPLHDFYAGFRFSQPHLSCEEVSV